MKLYKKGTLLTLFAFHFIFNGYGQTASLVYQKTVNSVVTIETDIAIGSGFFIANNLIATNYHVIDGAANAIIYLNSTNKSFEVEGYVAKDEINDLAILKVSYTKGVPLKFAFKSVKQGDDILAIGSPKGIPATISKGIVSNLNSEIKLIQIDASISHGSSGGPVLNMNGEVIGVAVGTIANGQNLNFAIPVKLLEYLLSFKSSYVKKLGDEEAVVKEESSFKPEFDNSTLISFSDGNKTTKKDFLRIYNKNMKEKTKDGCKDYLNLFINYKLKVIQAEELGLDKTDSFKKEIGEYTEQLKAGFQFDSNAVEKLVKEVYERQKFDVRTKHILLKVDPNSSPEDTLKAFNKIIQIRNEVLQGEDFANEALKYSEDPSVKDNSGDLGYFTGMQMIYSFETAAYTTNINQVSMPVRTKYGYHLIKVIDKRGSLGQFLVKHIMVKCNKDNSLKEHDAAKEKIELVYKKLRRGENFDALAISYSDDKGSKDKGGELPWFGVGRMDPEFERVTIELKKLGEWSEPVQTSYGWHIIKLVDKKGLPSYEEARKTLKEAVLKDSRSSNIGRFSNSEVDELPEYKALIKEYRDGILLFDITDQMVWSKALRDTEGLRNYYNANQSKYNYQNLDDIKEKVTKDYQDYLEKAWIEKLRKEFPFAVNEKVLKEILDSL